MQGVPSAEEGENTLFLPPAKLCTHTIPVHTSGQHTPGLSHQLAQSRTPRRAVDFSHGNARAHSRLMRRARLDAHRRAPVNGMATSPEASTDVTDQRRSSQVAALSPCQCAAYAPEPGKLDLRGACQARMVAGSMRGPSTCLAWTLGVRLP